MAPAPVREDGECMNHDESVPTTWDDVRDDQFFRIVCHVLDAPFLEGASSLLSANDLELSAP
jgi:hypothetical protein